ncbi:hypothetical protein [Calothrix sp. PCC 6303]|uniref:hypothetical protein n=1 Tax=Calothrix sp. PCC 6303 TaxID=1170562 RepID=UPI0002A03F97|nr:hypothetical protein Cal6303_2334 [Calothrix sp. PCC 6303]
MTFPWQPCISLSCNHAIASGAARELTKALRASKKQRLRYRITTQESLIKDLARQVRKSRFF